MKTIVVYRCQNCGGAEKIIERPGVREVVLSCGGQLEVIHILRAFEDGADGVCVAHCDPAACKTLQGSATARRRVAYARRLLEEIPFDPQRLASVSCEEGVQLQKAIADFLGSLKKRKPPKPGGRKGQERSR